MKKELSIGKFRGLQQISNRHNVFTIMAMDHRGSLKKAINPNDPASVTYQDVVDLKQDVAGTLAGRASAVLSDLTYGAPQIIASGALPGQIGLLVTLEETGYQGDAYARRNFLVDGWSPGKIKRMGGTAVKLLLYYHPRSAGAADQEALLRDVVAQCNKHDIPLVLEVLLHAIDPAAGKDSAEFAAARLCPMGADAFKAEFPADVRFERDEGKMLAWCEQLTGAAGVPWMVLSAGVDHETFCKQVEISCRGGASGFLAGRSIWKNAIRLQGAERKEHLATIAAGYLDELSEIATRYAHPWSDWYQCSVPEGWSAGY